VRVPTDLPRRRPRMTRGRVWLIVGVVVVVVVIASLRGLATFYTDYLWFGSVKLTNVWKGMLGAKVGLAVVFMAVFFAAMWANLAIADRVVPKFLPLGPEDELVQRFRDAIGSRGRLVRLLVSLVFAVLVGAGASAHWNDWILFHNAVPFGYTDPQFHRDAGFYVFRLPFISFVVSWVFLALVVIAIVLAVAYYLNGGIRLQGPGPRVNPHVKAHLSVILGLMAVDKAVGYYYQRFSLSTSTRGFVEGPTYTDVHAQLPALTLLTFIMVAAFVIFVVNIWRQGWVLPVIGVGLWLFTAFVVGVVYPAFIQHFKVQPSQNTLELPYIARNIAATRYAMGISHVQVHPYSASANLTPGTLANATGTLNSVRLWEPDLTMATYEKLQAIRSYYQFNELALDRYVIDGVPTPVIVGVRQLNVNQLPASTWVNSHLQYTHGYGAIISPANAYTTPDGNPVFSISDVPPVSKDGLPNLTQPSVYYGLNLSGYVIADSKQPELDYQTLSGNTKEGHYTGTGGVPAGSLLRRAAFSLAFGDINPLISGQVTSQSRVMYYRDIRQMVAKAAPFLQMDSDPYPVVLHGQIYWMQDAYTTTDRFPYGQQADTSGINNPASGLNSSFNYVRNSVKILIDAYNGTMTFYVTDPRDPIVKVYENAFPGMFTPMSAMPADLRAHLRYPEDLFAVQAAMYGRYHITQPSNFYNAGDAWNLSQNPGTGSPSAALTTTAPTNAQGNPTGPGQVQRMSPIYQEMQIPGDSGTSFNILEAFVPKSTNDVQQNLSAFMIADCDPDHYGRLQAFVTPRGQQIDGPALVDARISGVPAISQQLTLLNQQGSQVSLGNVLMLPVDNSLIYVRPLYVQSSRNSLPEFKKIIVVYGTQAVIDNNLPAALQDVFGSPIPGLSTGASGQAGPLPQAPLAPPPASGAANPTVQRILSQAQAVYNQALSDLKNGNLGAYQNDVNQLGSLVQQAAQAAGAPSPGSSPSTTTTPSSTAPSNSA